MTGLKAHEISMEFFLTLGWNVNNWTPGNIASFVTAEAARDFGPANAADIADIVMQTYQLNIARRPEFMDKALFNSVNYGDEAQQRLDAFNALLTRATTISNALPTAQPGRVFRDGSLPVARQLLPEPEIHRRHQGRALCAAGAHGVGDEVPEPGQYRLQHHRQRSHRSTPSGIQNGKWQSVLNPYSTTGGRPAIAGLPSMASARADLGAAPGRRLGGADHRQREPAADILVVLRRTSGSSTFFTKGSAGFAWTATPSAA